MTTILQPMAELEKRITRVKGNIFHIRLHSLHGPGQVKGQLALRQGIAEYDVKESVSSAAKATENSGSAFDNFWDDGRPLK